MANQKGIAITIRAFLLTGSTLKEQHAALTLVTNAHETGDYTEVLKLASIEEVKAESKTRRAPEAPPPTPSGDANQGGQTGGDEPDPDALRQGDEGPIHEKAKPEDHQPPADTQPPKQAKGRKPA